MQQPFRLELDTLYVERLVPGPHTALDGHTLVVDSASLEALICADERFASASVEIASPGDDVRIVHCLDAVEPRVKREGPGCVFPGFLGGPETVGRGRTLRLAGLSVLASSRFPQPFSGLLTAREAIVDMSGPTAAYSPFSRVHNLVLSLAPRPGLDNVDYDDAVRRAGLRVADHLARLGLERTPDETTIFDFAERDPALPNVAYFYQCQGQGSTADTYLYGRTIENLVPTLIHPNEVMDGAIVSGVYVYGCFKNPTYLHQNNPVIWELRARHGRDLNFAGVILNRGHNYTQMEKERSSYWAAKLAGMLGVDGVILTGEGGGNSAIDLMLACKYMEQAGIKTSLLSVENTGSDGRDFPLFYSVPEADAVVSVGSDSEALSLPRVAKVIGDNRLLDNTTDAAGPFTAGMYYMYCATNQLGANVLAGRQF